MSLLFPYIFKPPKTTKVNNQGLTPALTSPYRGSEYDREYDYIHRILYGTAKAITEHLNESELYSKVKKIISVNILYFDLGHGEDYVYHGKTVFKGIHKSDELLLSEKQKEFYQKKKIAEVYPDYYLIKINQFDDKAKDTLDEWIYFLDWIVLW